MKAKGTVGAPTCFIGKFEVQLGANGGRTDFGRNGIC
jgi:hypothetical protein